MREGVRNCFAQFWLAMKVKMNKDGNESSLLLILEEVKKRWKGCDMWIWFIRVYGWMNKVKNC